MGAPFVCHGCARCACHGSLTPGHCKLVSHRLMREYCTAMRAQARLWTSTASRPPCCASVSSWIACRPAQRWACRPARRRCRRTKSWARCSPGAREIVARLFRQPRPRLHARTRLHASATECYRYSMPPSLYVMRVLHLPLPSAEPPCQRSSGCKVNDKKPGSAF